MRALWHVLVGPPVRARDVSREQITPVEGLSALSLDALTSVAYGPEAIIAVLAVAGAGALRLVLPVTVAIVVVPVTGVSRLAQYGISVALSISEHVEAVTVVRSGAAGESERVRELQRQWTRWNPGVPLRVLRTEYASVARPIVAFVDRLRRHCNEPVIVLIPVALPDRLRYRFLHNHVDLVLTRELRYRPDVVVARVPVRVHVQAVQRR